MGELDLKRVLFSMGMTGVLIVAACGNSSENAENLIEHDMIEHGSWVDYNGENTEDDDMRVTETITYHPEGEYELNRSSYVSYYNGEEFLETVLYSEEPPMEIDTVEAADNIRVSFNSYNEENISLKKID